MVGFYVGEWRSVFLAEVRRTAGRDLRALGHLKLAAIGPTTAEALAGYHLRADLVPDTYRSEALAAALGRVGQGPQNPAGPRGSRPDASQG